jgi:hypothetical protein
MELLHATISKHIKMDLRDIGCGVIAWIDLAQDIDQTKVVVNTVIYLRVP